MMRCRMRGHAQQNNLSCRLAGAKKGVRFTITPPYAHIQAINEHLFRFKMNADSSLHVHRFWTALNTNSGAK